MNHGDEDPHFRAGGGGFVVADQPAVVHDRHEKLTARYLELVKEHQSTVVVSQSWNEIHQVNDAIRVALRREKLMGEAETMLATFQPVA